jgi:hypothetical protein
VRPIYVRMGILHETPGPGAIDTSLGA